MKYGICLLSVIPVRAENSDKSEIITQILFGEILTIISEKKNWIKIQLSYDNYTGWIDPKQIKEIDKKLALLNIQNQQYLNEGTTTINGITKKLSYASILPIKQITDLYKISIQSPTITSPVLIDVAKRYLGTPYLWGGKSDYGIDCSGFTQQVFKVCGIKLPRDAYQQAQLGEPIQTQNSQAGDLAFFENKDGRIIHVGIILKNQEIIHAHGEIKINKLDNKGILSDDLSGYSHQLSLIRRVK